MFKTSEIFVKRLLQWPTKHGYWHARPLGSLAL